MRRRIAARRRRRVVMRRGVAAAAVIGRRIVGAVARVVAGRRPVNGTVLSGAVVRARQWRPVCGIRVRGIRRICRTVRAAESLRRTSRVCGVALRRPGTSSTAGAIGIIESGRPGASTLLRRGGRRAIGRQLRLAVRTQAGLSAAHRVGRQVGLVVRSRKGRRVHRVNRRMRSASRRSRAGHDAAILYCR